jgi:hypothetical protein
MRAKGHCCRIFTPAQPVYPAASLRDFLSGAYTSAIGALVDRVELKSDGIRVSIKAVVPSD